MSDRNEIVKGINPSVARYCDTDSQWPSNAQLLCLWAESYAADRCDAGAAIWSVSYDSLHPLLVHPRYRYAVEEAVYGPTHADRLASLQKARTSLLEGVYQEHIITASALLSFAESIGPEQSRRVAVARQLEYLGVLAESATVQLWFEPESPAFFAEADIELVNWAERGEAYTEAYISNIEGERFYDVLHHNRLPDRLLADFQPYLHELKVKGNTQVGTQALFYAMAEVATAEFCPPPPGSYTNR